jgi:tryptophan synthase alpha chain
MSKNIQLNREGAGEASISRAFKRARSSGRNGVLVGFLTAGDPSEQSSIELCRAVVRGGADILELGVPFSDPLADGPTIQAADLRALESGTTLRSCLGIARKIREESSIPIVLLTYYNPIFKFGLEEFMKEACNCVSGLVVPDLPSTDSDEFGRYKAFARKHGLATILLVAPTTTKETLDLLMKNASGFLYLVSLLGVTGARMGASAFNLPFIQRVSRIASEHSLPSVVGFGVSNKEHVETIMRSGASGVIVGSALVNIVEQNLRDMGSATSKLENFVRELRSAT